MAFLALILEVLAVTVAKGFILSSAPTQACYGELGCFTTDAPFKSTLRDVSFLPQARDVVKTTFYLYTRSTPTTADEKIIKAGDPATINGSHFSSGRPTKLIVHGFTHNAHRQWILNMVSELLKHEDSNVITVDWGHGAGLPYGQATANTRLVGAEIAFLVNTIIANFSMTAGQFHIIGHSLGAHIAGYAGERIKGLGRISALDPASPYFENTPAQVRVDPSDAVFVDAIHTDASGIIVLGLGMKQAVGHVDFYVNGGHDQPGCNNNLLSRLTHTAWNAALIDKYAAEATVACSHERSMDLYIESINSDCPFAAFPCAGEDQFKHGRCLDCLEGQCSRMGYHADRYPARGSLYLTTEAAAPYCHYHYSVNITSDSPMDGILQVTLHGTAGDSRQTPLTQQAEVVTARSVITHLLTTKKYLGDLTGLTLTYEKSHNLLIGLMYADKWQLMGLTAINGETQTKTGFCAYGKSITNHVRADFKVVGQCDA